MLCGLPASGKTTAAARLHAALGGALVRSCDVYRDLGIDLPAWVRRTAGFTRDVAAYERLRDLAYVEMAARLEAQLAAGARPVIVDAVHGERAKREVVYARCWMHGRQPLLVWCRCDDLAQVRARFRARRGRPEPEHEAADLSVYRHIRGLWESPWTDPAVAAGMVPVVVYDSVAGRVAGAAAPAAAAATIRGALAAAPAGT